MYFVKKARNILLLWAVVLLPSCQKSPMEGGLEITFAFTFDGEALETDDHVYTIESGEAVKITGIQYFISRFALVDKNGGRHSFSNEGNKIHYIDSDIASSLKWQPDEKIPSGIYEYVEFIYGLDSQYNQSGYFVNPPQANMFWPDVLGGGYHYMKLNGYWAAAEDSVFLPFGLHTGIGQVEEGQRRFCQNYVSLRDTVRLYIADNHTSLLQIDMDVAEWFRNPHTWRFSQFGGSIMQNQQAQQVLKENAASVFSLR